MPTNSLKVKQPDILREMARLQKKVQRHTEGLAAAKREIAEKAAAAAQAMRDRKALVRKQILAGVALLETVEDASHPLHVANLALLNKAMTKATDRALFAHLAPLADAAAIAPPPPDDQPSSAPDIRGPTAEVDATPEHLRRNPPPPIPAPVIANPPADQRNDRPPNTATPTTPPAI